VKSSEFGGIERGIDRRRGIFEHVLAPVSTPNVLHQLHIFEARISKALLSAGLSLERRCSRLTPRSGREYMLMQPASSLSPGRKDRTAPSLELYPLHLGDCVIDSKQNRKPRKQQSTLRQWGRDSEGVRPNSRDGEKRNCLASHGIISVV
jgi:hypothetical protein